MKTDQQPPPIDLLGPERKEQAAVAATGGPRVDGGSSEASFDINHHRFSFDDGIAGDQDRQGSTSALSNSSASKETRRLQRPIHRGAQACSQCRQHKIKCIPSDSDNPFPCTRCVNQNLVCEVLQHNRGRKRKNTGPEAPVQPKKQAAVYYPTQERGTSSSEKLSTSSASASTIQNPSGSATDTFSNPRREARGPNLTLNTSVARPGTNSTHTSPIYDQSGNNLHVLEQAIAMQLPYSHPSQHMQQPSGLHISPNAAVGHGQTVNKQAQDIMANSAAHSFPDPHSILAYPGSSPQMANGQAQHMRGNAMALAAGDASSSAAKPTLPYQYGASNYALPPPVPAKHPQHYGFQLQNHQAPSNMHQHNQAQHVPSRHNSQSDQAYTYQPVSSFQQAQPLQQSLATPNTDPTSASSHSSILAPGAKLVDSPNRVHQDSAQSEQQLESVKFPFLLPKLARSGRRGLFSLKSIMNAEDVEELGPGSGARHVDHATLLATDPIEAGVLSHDDAKILFKLYMDEMSVLNSLLDPTIHTHDFVRSKSKFLYTAILSVISRYLNSTSHTTAGEPRRLVSPVYSYCRQAAQAHLKEVLGNVETSLEVVQGLAVLTFHKEPEDEKSCLHLYRAIAIAREIGLDQETTKHKPDLGDEEKRWIRCRQRVWLALFVANTILTMQFDMNTLIGPDDPAIASSARFAISSHLQTDTLLVASVQLRRLWHIYSDMARALEQVDETPSEKAAKLVSLSMLTRTSNRELEQAARDWKEECTTVGLTRIDAKIDVWLAAIKLRLNLAIVQMALPGLKERASMISNGFLPPRKATSGTGQSIELGCISAFHHSVNSACYLLQCMTAMEEKRLLSFAADTFLSFSIYSAFFLWTLCRDMGASLLEPGEVDHCFALIGSAATALESASLYPGDSCALHARFLRNLHATRSASKSSSTESSNFVSDGQVHGIASRMADNAMRDNRMMQEKEHPSNLPSGHPLTVLAQLQPPGYEHSGQAAAATEMPPALGGANAMSNYSQAAAPLDTMLMADWGTMQKDFPWVSSDISLPFLDVYVPPQAQQSQGMQPSAFQSQANEGWP